MYLMARPHFLDGTGLGAGLSLLIKKAPPDWKLAPVLRSVKPVLGHSARSLSPWWVFRARHHVVGLQNRQEMPQPDPSRFHVKQMANQMVITLGMNRSA